MRPWVIAACLGLAATHGLRAEEAAPPAEAVPAEPRVLETVVVSGVQPGPGLWRVSKDGHTMWILGTLSPLPKRMTWESGEVWRKIEQSGEVVMPAGAELTVDGGPLRGLFLLPSLLKARNNPGKQPLKEVVPPDRLDTPRPKEISLPSNLKAETDRLVATYLESLYGAGPKAANGHGCLKCHEPNEAGGLVISATGRTTCRNASEASKSEAIASATGRTASAWRDPSRATRIRSGRGAEAPPSPGRMTSIGIPRVLINSSATLPNQARSSPPRPWVVMTTRSAAVSLA